VNSVSLNVLHNLGGKRSLLRKTHIGREGAVWHPLGRVSGGSLLEHAIDLLERQTLGLGNQEVSVDNAAKAKRAPDEEDLGAEVAVFLTDHVGGDDSDDAVPEPVGGGRETDTTGTDGDGEDFSNHNPGCGTPGGGEEKDVDADECDE